MSRVYNFSAGPAVLPEEVLNEAAAEMLDYRGTGMSVMEMSHRSKSYETIIEDAESDLRDLLHIPENYKVLFLQGGGSTQFAMVPMNLMKNRVADYIITGQWAKKAHKEASIYGKANAIASSADKTFSYIPDCSDLPVSEDADYVYICENNTIYGTKFWTLPNTKGKLLVADQSSCFLSEPVDVSKYGLIFAGAQKNVGPAGTVIVIIREDLITEDVLEGTPTMLRYKIHADAKSLYNTPPTYGIYMCGKVFKWLKAKGGLEEMKKINEEKAKILYDFLDESKLFKGTVVKKDRSIMNVPFITGNEELDALFVKESKAAGLENLKGHRTVGGMRASIYNAMPKAGVEKLVEFMADFEKKHLYAGESIMKKIHCLNPIAACGTDLFPADYEMTDNKAEADAFLVRSASMHEMELPEGLLAVGRAGAGVNNIPLDECAKAGVVVFNTPGANANGVKELVLAGMFLASRDIVGGIKWCQDNAEDENIAKTTEKSKKAFAGWELKGKKLGVIGLGAIGAEVANAATHLGMEVYGYDPYISVNAAWRLSRNVKHITNVDTIFQECDYITVHVPLLESTKGMINKEKLDMMKDGVVILNFARDTLVNDDDMAAALEAGKVARYVSDFPNPKVVHMKHVILTPHLGASTRESEDNCAVMAVQEITDYLENGNIKNSVNYPACDMGVCQAASRIAVLHMNIPNMIGQITAILAAQGVNISDMTNKSRDKYAYTLLDLEHKPEETTVEKLKAIEGVLRVRVVK